MPIKTRSSVLQVQRHLTVFQPRPSTARSRKIIIANDQQAFVITRYRSNLHREHAVAAILAEHSG